MHLDRLPLARAIDLMLDEDAPLPGAIRAEKAKIARVIGWIAQNVRDFRYEDVRFEPTATGFVEQHMTCGTSPSGKPFAIPACIVCTVIDGRVSRLDEYLDSAQTAAIAG